jgi:hypothetical protein
MGREWGWENEKWGFRYNSSRQNAKLGTVLQGEDVAQDDIRQIVQGPLANYTLLWRWHGTALSDPVKKKWEIRVASVRRS